MSQKRMECFRLLFDHLGWIEHQFLSGIRDSRKAGCLWEMISGVGVVRKSIHQSWLAKGLGLGLLCWGFKGVQKEIPREETSTLQIGSVAFPPGQCTSPQFHPCHRLYDQDGHQDSSSPPYSPTFLPVTFGYSEAVIMRQLRRWKRLWRRSLTRSHKRTSMVPSRSCCNGTSSTLQPEEITSKWTSTFLCVLSIKVPIRKKSGNLSYSLCIYIYIGMCVCVWWGCIYDRESIYLKTSFKKLI